jgi:short-subunit dehydrogenase
MNLKGKRILLTGATGGVGMLVAQLLADKGAQLAIVGRDTAKLDKLKSQLAKSGAKVCAIVADLNETGAPQRVADEAIAGLGGLDVLINNAGILDFIAFETQSPERVDQMIHTNVTALIQLTNAAMPHFLAKNAGQFLFIGSIFGSLGFPHFATYCATKFAVHGFSQALRRELVDSNIGVTYIAPRAINTPMMNDNSAEMMKKSGNRLDAPEKVAGIIVKALEKETQEVFIGQPQTFFAWLNGVAPKMVNMGLKKQPGLARPFLKK